MTKFSLSRIRYGPDAVHLATFPKATLLIRTSSQRKSSGRGRGRPGGGQRRREPTRNDFPRDGVRKVLWTVLLTHSPRGTQLTGNTCLPGALPLPLPLNTRLATMPTSSSILEHYYSSLGHDTRLLWSDRRRQGKVTNQGNIQKLTSSRFDATVLPRRCSQKPRLV